MHEQDVDVLHAKFFPETIDVGAHARRIAGPRLRKHGDLVALHMLERLGNVWMTSVRIGRVEEAQTFVVTVQEKIGEALYAESSLVRVMSNSNSSCAHGKAAGLDPGVAQRDRIRCAELRFEIRHCPNTITQA